MTLLDRLEKKLRWLSIPNLTLYLVVGQVAFYLFAMTGKATPENMALVPEMVFHGQFWRLISFIFIPPLTNPLFAFFAWYLFYIMGTALENQWGVFRYNIYLAIAYLATVAFAFLTPESAASNTFLGGSVFLAFAFLYPDFQLLLFFILPIRIKWLALLTGVGYFLVLAFGDWSSRFLVLASICNFLLFFWRDIITRIKYGRQKMARQADRFMDDNKPRHRCVICGATEKTHRQLEFRYCGQCRPVSCYCIDHLPGHTHIQPPS
jgi:hypothetical protein